MDVAEGAVTMMMTTAACPMKARLMNMVHAAILREFLRHVRWKSIRCGIHFGSRT